MDFFFLSIFTCLAVPFLWPAPPTDLYRLAGPELWLHGKTLCNNSAAVSSSHPPTTTPDPVYTRPLSDASECLKKEKGAACRLFQPTTSWLVICAMYFKIRADQGATGPTCLKCQRCSGGQVVVLTHIRLRRCICAASQNTTQAKQALKWNACPENGGFR